MATRSFTEYIVSGRTYYKRHGEAKKAAREAQRIADETGRPYEMKILSGWIQEDPSGFVYDSEVTSEKVKVFKPKRRAPNAGRRRTGRRNAGRGSFRKTKKQLRKMGSIMKSSKRRKHAIKRSFEGTGRSAESIAAWGSGPKWRRRNLPRAKGRKVKGGRSVTLRNFTGTIVRKSDGTVNILGRGRKR